MRRAPPYLMTHPYSSDRVEALRAARHRRAITPPSIRPKTFARFHYMQAKLIGFLQTQGQTLARYPLSDTSRRARYARAIAYYRVARTNEARAELNSADRRDPEQSLLPGTDGPDPVRERATPRSPCRIIAARLS